MENEKLRRLCEEMRAAIRSARHFGSTSLAINPDSADAILDELDRLRAAEAASKARVEELETKITALLHDCETYREEIGRLTDAGAEKPRPCTCHPDDNPPVPCPQRYALSECRAAVAPPPPAAADRTPPGQSDTAFLKDVAHYVGCNGNGLRCSLSEDWIERLIILATAPKAEDVRREALNEAAALVSGWVPQHELNTTLARQIGENMAKAIRALADRSAL